MKYLIFLPITLLSFGVAFGGGGLMQLVTGEDDSTHTTNSRDVTVISWGATDSDAVLAGVAGASDKDQQVRAVPQESEINSDMELGSTSDGNNDTSTDFNCASEGGCRS